MSTEYERNFRIAYEGVIKTYGAGLLDRLRRGGPASALDKLIQREMVSERYQYGNLFRKNRIDQQYGLESDMSAIAGGYHGSMAGYYSLLADIHGCVPLSSRDDRVLKKYGEE